MWLLCLSSLPTQRPHFPHKSAPTGFRAELGPARAWIPPEGQRAEGSCKRGPSACAGMDAPQDATRQHFSQGAGTERWRIRSLIELMLFNKASKVTDKIQAIGKWKANRKGREQDQTNISLQEFLTVVCCRFKHRKMGNSYSPALIQTDMEYSARAEVKLTCCSHWHLAMSTAFLLFLCPFKDHIAVEALWASGRSWESCQYFRG